MNAMPGASLPDRDTATGRGRVLVPTSPFVRAALGGLIAISAIAFAPPPAVPVFNVGTDFKQVANLGPPVGNITWINSILQQNNSIYAEGMSVPQRLTFVAIPPRAGNNHVLTFAHQATKGGGLHAYDFLTSWAQGILVAQGKGPNGENLLDQLADPVAITGPSIGPPVTSAILQSLWVPANNPVVAVGDLPDNMGLIGGGSGAVAQQVAQYEASLGNRQITVRAPNGNPVSNVQVVFTGYFLGADQFAQYELHWTSASTTIGIEFAAHLAVGVSDGIVNGYGPGFGSSSISGGPYHFKLDLLDGVSLGSQDNQIKGADIVTSPPTCDIQGPNTVCQGATNVSFTGGAFDPTISYEWNINSNTSGASFCGVTNSNTVCVNAGASAGGFTLKLSKTNAGGSTGCDHSVTVNAATVTTVTPVIASVCSGATVSFTATTSGTGPFAFAWKKDGVTIAGATSSTLNLGPVGQTDEGTYCVTAMGACGSAVACSTLTVNALPQVTVTPASPTACSGDNVTLTATPTGAGPFSFAWSKQGNPLLLSTTNSLTLTNVQPGAAGTYCVQVTGACGTAIQCVLLTVNATTITTDPADKSACQGDNVTFTTTPSGTGPFTFVWTKTGSPLVLSTTSSLTLTNVQPVDAGQYCVGVTGKCFSAVQCATLTVAAATTTTDPADATTCDGGSILFTTTPSGIGPFTFVWTKTGSATVLSTTFALPLNIVHPGDAGEYCVQVTGSSCGVATQCATLTVGAPTATTKPADSVTCAGGTATFTTTPSGAGPFTFLWIKSGSGVPLSTTASLSLTNVQLSDAGQYCVKVEGPCGLDFKCATLTVNAPTTTTAPSSATRCPGDSVTFSTTASGTGPFSFQWTKNGAPIVGATNSSFTIPGVVAGDAGTYCVTATGACGSDNKCATLTIGNPVLVAPLDDVTVTKGSLNVVLGPEVPGGTPPFVYQWSKDGVPLAGATNDTLILAGPVQPSDAGQYCVQVGDSGSCGDATACLTLTVVAAPDLISGQRHPGSVGIFPVHRSGLGGGHVTQGAGAVFFTIVSVTNTDTQPSTPLSFGGATNVHYQYVNVTPNPSNPFLPLSCVIFDRVEYLSPADTLSVLTSCHNAVAPHGQQGYLVVSAQDPAQYDVDWSHNDLVGSELVVNGSGGMYEVGMVSLPSPKADQAPTDSDGDGQLDFDGLEYAALPDQVYIDSFVALADSRLALLNLTGGLQARNTLKIQAWNDNEFPMSATRVFSCWFDEPLQVVSPLFTQAFLSQNTPDDPQELDLDCNGTGDIETAWARIDSIDVSQPFGGQIASDGAVLGAITSGPSSLIDGGTLLWESKETQGDGSFSSP